MASASRKTFGDNAQVLIFTVELTGSRRSLKRNDTLFARQRWFVSSGFAYSRRIDRIETYFSFLAMFGALSGTIVARED
jgi:hypothetical protein